MLKFTKTTLQNLEKILQIAKYKVRYERGIFQSNHCILQEKRVVVINKFLPLEGRINVLLDVMLTHKGELQDLPFDNVLRRTFNQALGELELQYKDA